MGKERVMGGGFWGMEGEVWSEPGSSDLRLD